MHCILSHGSEQHMTSLITIINTFFVSQKLFIAVSGHYRPEDTSYVCFFLISFRHVNDNKNYIETDIFGFYGELVFKPGRGTDNGVEQKLILRFVKLFIF